MKVGLNYFVCRRLRSQEFANEMVSTDNKEKFLLLKAVFDNDLKELSSLLSGQDADEKDQFGKTFCHP